MGARGASEKAQETLRRARDWITKRVPPGLRFVVGLLLIIGGIFGFLPILGFWMVPLGIAVAATDVRLIRSVFAKIKERLMR